MAHFIMHFWSCFLLPSFQSAIATPIEQDSHEIGFTQTGLDPIYREDLSEDFSGQSSSRDMFHSSVRFQKSPWDLQNGTYNNNCQASKKLSNSESSMPESATDNPIFTQLDKNLLDSINNPRVALEGEDRGFTGLVWDFITGITEQLWKSADPVPVMPSLHVTPKGFLFPCPPGSDALCCSGAGTTSPPLNLDNSNPIYNPSEDHKHRLLPRTEKTRDFALCVERETSSIQPLKYEVVHPYRKNDRIYRNITYFSIARRYPTHEYCRQSIQCCRFFLSNVHLSELALIYLIKIRMLTWVKLISQSTYQRSREKVAGAYRVLYNPVQGFKTMWIWSVDG